MRKYTFLLSRKAGFYGVVRIYQKYVVHMRAIIMSIRIRIY